MRLSNEWFTALSENETGQLVTVSGRDENKMKMAAAMNLFMGGSAFIYYGEEIGMPGSGKTEIARLMMKKSRSFTKLTSYTTDATVQGAFRVRIAYNNAGSLVQCQYGDIHTAVLQ